MSSGGGEFLALGLFVAVCAATLLGFPVAFTLAGTSLLFAGFGYLLGHFDPILLVGLAPRYFGVMTNETLVAVPIFVFMGLVLERSGIAEHLLLTMGQLFGRRSGGLGFAVVIVGAILAASTGVVGATVVTMGLISLPAMLRAGYDKRLACGAICASGTLAQIIPPSTVLILVADILTGVNQEAQLELGNFSPRPVSVGDLFAGAILPGLLLVLLYLAFVAWTAWRNPERAPALPMSAAERRELPGRLLVSLLAPLLLILAVLGSILAGIATATESASLGAVAVLAFAALRGRLSFRLIREAVLGTASTTSMIFVLLLGASTFSLVFRGLGGEGLVEDSLRAAPGGAFGAMLIFVLVMFVLGFVLDTFEVIFVMLPIFGPPLLKLGYDPVWLGVMVGVKLQTSFLTPPFGATLFYIRGVAPPEITTADIWASVVPWALLQLGALIVLWTFPGLATWLPGRVFG